MESLANIFVHNKIETSLISVLPKFDEVKVCKHLKKKVEAAIK